MPNRKKLIELIMQSTQKCDSTDCNRCKYWNTNDCGAARMADSVISDGWIRPPCKPGDELFRVVELLNGERFVVEGIAFEYTETFLSGTTEKRIFFLANGEDLTRRRYSIWLEISAFGKTVFLTREEAEKSLKERENNERKTST